MSPACGFRAELGKAHADTAALSWCLGWVVRGSALKRHDPRGAEYRGGVRRRTGSQ